MSGKRKLSKKKRFNTVKGISGYNPQKAFAIQRKKNKRHTRT